MPLPVGKSIYERAAAVAVGVSLLSFIGDFPTFHRADQLRYTLLYSLIGLTTFATAAFSYFLLGVFTLRRGSEARLSVPSEILAAVVAIIPGIIIPHAIDSHYYEEPLAMGDFWGYFVYAIIIATAVTLYYAHRQSLRDLIELRAKTAEARYELLKNQMQPHFLFNAFNSLSELCAESPKLAEAFTQKLADLYKRILENSDRKTATLASEMEIIEGYLAIEKIRYGNRLSYELSLPKNAANIYLPSLMAQTLVENAVKHGISRSLQGGKIVLTVKAAGPSRYLFSLRNTGGPLSTVSEGNGLTNTRHRLELLYGATHDFRVFSTENSETEASFYFSGAALG